MPGIDREEPFSRPQGLEGPQNRRGTPDPESIQAGDGEGEEIACWVCGGAVVERHCKIICQVCGFTRDCSDP